MIVLFTQNRATRRMALVTVDIDEETAVHSDRCNCWRSGNDGASCAIAAVERKSGKLELSAQRFESRNDTDWNIAKLALEQRRNKEYVAAYWKNVRRQIEFTVGARHARSHFKRKGTYAHLLNVAARAKVLLYDTRGLIGADEVILHVIRKKHSMEPFLSDGQDVHIKPAETVKPTGTLLGWGTRRDFQVRKCGPIAGFLIGSGARRDFWGTLVHV
ncbi:hypothetical protein CPLU01_16063 [Colletotrichum plurivorum]|uniref:Uncharacterized protein n=1 Tax=Colletotrichum plurivorum TaxID=2175906 RepID=A0A8H6J0Z6_9PEZI|nr:hypothetical protein CPLU01_16063 [Colletotrichum plurivorum]